MDEAEQRHFSPMHAIHRIGPQFLTISIRRRIG
jgi:hypothetical protein